MKTTLTTRQAIDTLLQDQYAGWTYEEAEALILYYEEFEEDTGEEIELDAVAVRCDWSSETEEYEVFFSITRQSSRMLRIYVESAYVREPEKVTNKPVHLKRRDKVRAKVLLAKKLRGEPIRRPTGGRKRR